MTTSTTTGRSPELSLPPESALAPAMPQGVQVRRVLVIKLRHYGDMLLTTPLFSTLKANYPDAEVDVLLYGGTEDILLGNTELSLRHIVKRKLSRQGLKAQYRGERDLLKSLQARRYDLILNLSMQWRTALYCRLLRPAFSIGFQYARRDSWLWRHCHSQLADTSAQVEQHTVLGTLGILQPLGLPTIRNAVTMAYRDQDVERVAQLCRERDLADYIVIQPTARWRFKTWSLESFAQLINHLTARGQTVVLTAGPAQAEQDSVARILAACTQPDRVVNLAGQLAFPELAVLLLRAKLFIGVDSVPMHMAAALKTPSVVLFGPTNLKQWHPWQTSYTMLWAGDYRQIPLPEQVDTDTDDRYLDAIPVADVIRAVDARLDQTA